MEDFKERCAYSMMHLKAVAEKQMHVDHHDPRLKKASPYKNLFPAYAVCNLAKGDRPDDEDRRNGMRLLNPCEETEYGEHIFEDPTSHELVGTSALAIFHIEILDLNNPTLVAAREERALIVNLLRRPIEVLNNTNFNDAGFLGILEGFRALLRFKIPEIPAPPAP